jgi:hypothetical protein
MYFSPVWLRGELSHDVFPAFLPISRANSGFVAKSTPHSPERRSSPVRSQARRGPLRGSSVLVRLRRGLVPEGRPIQNRSRRFPRPISTPSLPASWRMTVPLSSGPRCARDFVPRSGISAGTRVLWPTMPNIPYIRTVAPSGLADNITRMPRLRRYKTYYLRFCDVANFRDRA